jgi:flagellar assembly factor FliW
MPAIHTRYFGTIPYREPEVLIFERGLPGFEQETRFLPVRQPELEPFVFLQSAATPDLCFPAVPVAAVCPGYRLESEAEELRELGVGESAGAALCLAIVTFNEDGPPTANLLAPVVIHVPSRRAAQVIDTGGGYSHRHPLNVDGGACP